METTTGRPSNPQEAPDDKPPLRCDQSNQMGSGGPAKALHPSTLPATVTIWSLHRSKGLEITPSSYTTHAAIKNTDFITLKAEEMGQTSCYCFTWCEKNNHKYPAGFNEEFKFGLHRHVPPSLDWALDILRSIWRTYSWSSSEGCFYAADGQSEGRI